MSQNLDLDDLQELSAEQSRNLLFWDVQEFQRKFCSVCPDRPTPMGTEVREMRKRLCREEFDEFMQAIDSGNLAEIAAEACDLIFVVMGTLVACGIAPGRFWRAIHKANMQKEADPSGGKVRKPQGWKKPDFQAILESMMMRTIPKGEHACGQSTPGSVLFPSRLQSQSHHADPLPPGQP